MKRARFSEEQIISILNEAGAGAKVTELCRRHGISDATFLYMRNKYGGLEVSEMRPVAPARGREPTVDIDRGRQALAIRASKDVLAKNGYGPR